MAYKYITAICVIIALCGGIAVEAAYCPPVGQAPGPRQLLDLDLLVGEWNMLRAGPASVSSNRSVDCITYTISRSSFSTHFLDLVYKERINGTIINTANEVASIEDVPSHWDVVDPTSYMPTDVVATDYVNYMIWYLCNDALPEPVWMIFGRQTALSADLMNSLYSFLEGYGFLKEKFVEIGHENC